MTCGRTVREKTSTSAVCTVSRSKDAWQSMKEGVRGMGGGGGVRCRGGEMLDDDIRFVFFSPSPLSFFFLYFFSSLFRFPPSLFPACLWLSLSPPHPPMAPPPTTILTSKQLEPSAEAQPAHVGNLIS